MKFPFQRYNIIDIIANDLKLANDKIKMINCFFLCKLAAFASDTKNFSTASWERKS